MHKSEGTRDARVNLARFILDNFRLIPSEYWKITAIVLEKLNDDLYDTVSDGELRAIEKTALKISDSIREFVIAAVLGDGRSNVKDLEIGSRAARKRVVQDALQMYVAKYKTSQGMHNGSDFVSGVIIEEIDKIYKERGI